jgi:L-alanine-DL-glutamate epimerase-like enolase superfamily enzyme
VGRTTLVYVEVNAGGQTGIGFTYADIGTAKLVDSLLRETIVGTDALQIGARWNDMYGKTRNLGRDGITSMAISAVDVASGTSRGRSSASRHTRSWARSASVYPCMGAAVLPRIRKEQLCAQLAGWVAAGIPRVKMKVGRDPRADIERVAAARRAIGNDAELFVDANGAYGVQQAIDQARVSCRTARDVVRRTGFSRRLRRGRVTCASECPAEWRSPTGSMATGSTSSRE